MLTSLQHLVASQSDFEQVKFSELMADIMTQTDRLGIYNWVYFIVIYVLLIFIYNRVFRTRKLPLLKSLIVYVLIGLGAFMLLIFQIDAGLPIVFSLGIAVLMMGLVWVRYFIAGRRARKQPKQSNE